MSFNHSRFSEAISNSLPLFVGVQNHRNQADGRHSRAKMSGTVGNPGSGGSRGGKNSQLAQREDGDENELPLNPSSFLIQSGADSLLANGPPPVGSSSLGPISANVYYGVGSSSGTSAVNSFSSSSSQSSALPGGNRSMPSSPAHNFGPSGSSGRGAAPQSQPTVLSFSGTAANSGLMASSSDRHERAAGGSSLSAGAMHAGATNQGRPSASRSASAAQRNPAVSTTASAGQFRLPPGTAMSRSTPFQASGSSPNSRGSGFPDSHAVDAETLGVSRNSIPNSIGSSVGNANPTSSSAGALSGAAALGASRRGAYYSGVSKPGDDEFRIQNEDFPALPVTSSFRSGDSKAYPFSGSLYLAESTAPLTGSVPVEPGREVGGAHSSSAGIIGQRTKPAGVQSLQTSLGSSVSAGAPVPVTNGPGEEVPSASSIKTTQDGTMNIPEGMVSDHFGVAGMLAFIRAAENQPSLVSLALGTDLTSLGLDLSSNESLYPSFTSPFADWPSRPQDIDCLVPEEYYTRSTIGDKLAPIKLHRYCEDLLFFLYYHR